MLHVSPTDSWSEVVHGPVVQLDPLVDHPPSPGGLLVLPVLDDLVHGDVSLVVDL